MSRVFRRPGWGDVGNWERCGAADTDQAPGIPAPVLRRGTLRRRPSADECGVQDDGQGGEATDVAAVRHFDTDSIDLVIREVAQKLVNGDAGLELGETVKSHFDGSGDAEVRSIRPPVIVRCAANHRCAEASGPTTLTRQPQDALSDLRAQDL